MTLLPLSAAALLLLAVSPPAPTPPVRRALVVAHNGADVPSLAPLRFADDDGVRWVETLERLGIETTLLTTPDAQTAAQASPVLARAQPPTRAALTAAVEALRRRNAEDAAAGRPVDVLFVYVGHGNTDDSGRAYLTLADARLYQSGLYQDVVEKLGADFVHLVVDACHAAGVVGSRGGADAKVLEKLQGTLAHEQLSRYPKVGAIFAETDSGETHEWTQLRAGIFSHAARSALLGAADVNLDGQVEYSELDAFVAAATLAVASQHTRLRVHTLPPPQNPRRPLVGPPPPGPVLVLPPGLVHTRLWIEDDAGVRLADVHRDAAEPTRLWLPEREAYWLRTESGEARLPRVSLDYALPELRARAFTGRGPEEDSLRAGLFDVPFSRSFYRGWVARSGLVPVALDAQALAHMRWSPARRRWGVEAGLLASMAPLAASAGAGGLALGWRTPGGPWRFGARASYLLSPRTWYAHASLHRLSLHALAGYSGAGEWAPFAEAGLGWALVAISTPAATQGDVSIPTARLATGAVWTREALLLRAGLSLSADWATIDEGRRLTWLPALEFSVEM